MKQSHSSPRNIRTPWTEFWRKFKKQHLAMAAGGVVLLLVVLAIAGPLRRMTQKISLTTTESMTVRRLLIGSALIQWDVIFSAGY
jgi:hypothetical protein